MRIARFLVAAAVVLVTACSSTSTRPAPAPARPRPGAGPIAIETGYASMESRIRYLVNEERRRHGLLKLVLNPQLDQAAKLHAHSMATYMKMTHVIPESRFPTLTHRAQYVAYPYAMIAENIALGYTDAESVVRGWMESPGHRRNILDPEVSEIGTGVVISGRGGLYFCQVFGRRLSSI